MDKILHSVFLINLPKDGGVIKGMGENFDKSVKMSSKIKARLKELKEEYQKGQEQLIALEQETASLSNTMLRISGAIQVLEELIGNNEASTKSNDENADLEMIENAEK